MTEREARDLLAQIGDELKLQAWLARAELKRPSLDQDASMREEVDALAQLRDELRLQLHLGKLEARDEFERLEDRWRNVMRTAVSTATGTAQTLRGLLREIREGYRGLSGHTLDQEPTGA